MSNYVGNFNPEGENNPWNKVYDMISPNTNVLDIGCSTGSFGEALKEYKQCKVDGVEPDRGDAEQAAKKLVTVYNSTLEDAFEMINKQNKKYDYIVFLDVIEHLYSPSDKLRLVSRLLKKDGKILFSIPNMGHISTRIALLEGKFTYGETGLLDKTHLHFYTKEEIERVFEEADLAVTAWNSTDATYTRAVIRSELKRIGIIEISKKLQSELESPDANIFQYVGAAEVAKNKTLLKKREQYFPNPQGTLTQWIEQREHDIASLLDLEKQKVLEKDQEIRLLNSSIARYQKILHSPLSLAKHFTKKITKKGRYE